MQVSLHRNSDLEQLQVEVNEQLEEIAKQGYIVIDVQYQYAISPGSRNRCSVMIVFAHPKETSHIYLYKSKES